MGLISELDYEVKDGATGSPNSRVRFNVKAMSVLNPPTTTDLPEPATLSLFALGLGGLAAAGRRGRKRRCGAGAA